MAAVARGQIVEEQKLKTDDPALPEMHFFIRLPQGANGESLPVKRVWILFTYLSKAEDLRKLLNGEGMGKWVLPFADEQQLAIISGTTKTVYRIDKSEDEMQKEERKAQNERFEGLSRTVFKAIAIFSIKQKLPRTPYLLSGSSRGGQWAHRMGLEAPERFLAVHADINSSFDEPTEKGKSPFWLITTGELEWGYKAAIRFYQKSREMGYSIFFKALPKVGHSVDPRNIQLGFEFFRYAIAMEEREDRYNGFWNPPFYGDLLNQSVMEDQEEIPERLRVPLPTESIRNLWR